MQETQVRDIGESDLTSDLCAAPSLVDDQLESVFRDGAIGIEEIAQSIIRGICEITLNFSPFDQSAHRFISIVPDEAIGANGCLDSPPDLIGFLFDFSCVRAESEIGETK